MSHVPNAFGLYCLVLCSGSCSFLCVLWCFLCASWHIGSEKTAFNNGFVGVECRSVCYDHKLHGGVVAFHFYIYSGRWDCICEQSVNVACSFQMFDCCHVTQCYWVPSPLCILTPWVSSGVVCMQLYGSRLQQSGARVLCTRVQCQYQALSLRHSDICGMHVLMGSHQTSHGAIASHLMCMRSRVACRLTWSCTCSSRVLAQCSHRVFAFSDSGSFRHRRGTYDVSLAAKPWHATAPGSCPQHVIMICDHTVYRAAHFRVCSVLETSASYSDQGWPLCFCYF